MAASKTKKNEAADPAEEHESEHPEAVEEVPPLPAVPAAGIPASAPGGPVPGRKSLGVKEPIVFKWKIIGRSAGMNVTLFKAVEREEVEAQLERLTRDGYYTHLQILEASAKVEQPPQPARKTAKPPEPPAKPKEKATSPSKAAAASAPKSAMAKKKSSPTQTSEKPKPKASKRTAKKK